MNYLTLLYHFEKLRSIVTTFVKITFLLAGLLCQFLTHEEGWWRLPLPLFGSKGKCWFDFSTNHSKMAQNQDKYATEHWRWDILLSFKLQIVQFWVPLIICQFLLEKSQWNFWGHQMKPILGQPMLTFYKLCWVVCNLVRGMHSHAKRFQSFSFLLGDMGNSELRSIFQQFLIN